MKSAPTVLTILALLFAMSLPSVVLAQPDEPDEDEDNVEVSYASSGFYVWVGAAIGVTTKAADQLSTVASVVGGTPIPVDVSSAAGFNGRLGLAGRIISSEIQFEYIPSFEASVLNIPFSEWSIFTTTTNLKAQIPLGRFQPYALLGGGFTRSALSSPLLPGVSTDFWGGTIRAGGGLNVYITEHIALAGDVTYVIPFGDNEDLDYVSIGIGAFYKF